MLYGGAKRDRTADPDTASVVLSQLSYCPTSKRRRRTVCRLFPFVPFLKAEEDRGGDEEREEGEPEDIGAEAIPHLTDCGNGVSAQADQVEDDAA